LVATAEQVTSRPKPKTQPKKIIRLTISDIAKGGDGVAHTEIDGSTRAVLIARTVPGDLVDARVPLAGGLLRGELLSVVSAGAERVKPACPHFEECGGCDLMHLSSRGQRAYRERVVEVALRKALIGDVKVTHHDAPIVAGYRRRARVFIECGKNRTICGFRAAFSHRVIEVANCLVLEPSIDKARSRMSTWLAGSSGRGEALIQPGREGRPCISLRWYGELAAQVFREAEKRVLDGEWAGVSVLLEGASSAAVIGDAHGRTLGVDDLPFETSVGGFMQAFDVMNRELVKVAVEDAGCEGERVLELFSGAGNISVALARKTAFLETVESEAGAVEAARKNLAERGLSARMRVADANQAKPSKDTRVVVLDPPRTGAAEASEAVAKSGARRVVMVSCDPATLARDIEKLMAGGFEVEKADVFEMFPQTSHVELVLKLSRAQGRKSVG
jgi:23S rRNA (uracil1939-C5)-methyltransferase